MNIRLQRNSLLYHFTLLGNVYIADSQRIRKVTASTGIITTFAGGGSYVSVNVQATSSALNYAWDVGSDASGTYHSIA